MSLKGLLRRTRDRFLYTLFGRVGTGLEFFSGLLNHNVYSRDSYSHSGTAYTIEVDRVTCDFAPFTKYNLSVTVDGIKLPRFPRNLNACLLVSDVFTKMMLDYGNRKLFPWGKDVTFERRGWKKFPSYIIEQRDEGHAKAKNTIDVYQEHRKDLEAVLKEIKREYPETDAEKSDIIRRLELPLRRGYVNSDCSAEILHPYADGIIDENTPMFSPDPLRWFVEAAQDKMSDEEGIMVAVSKLERFTDIVDMDSYRRVLVQNLACIDSLGMADIKWEQIDAAYPEARTVRKDFAESPPDKMFWIKPTW
jgi:hypothetical protein